VDDNPKPLELFLVATPGLEDTLAQEVKRLGFKGSKTSEGGVTLKADWADLIRANLELRTATRVLLRLGSFHVAHLAHLDKHARSFPWNKWLRKEVSVHVEASCATSKIYHSGAVKQRIAAAITEEYGAVTEDGADLRILARLEDDLCTLSIDTSGESLHKRGHKQKMHKAPLRETLAAAFLMQCGYTGNETVLDPMCGSGTFVIEAAEMAMGLRAGRARHFAFELMKKQEALDLTPEVAQPTPHRFYGYDRDAGAIAMSQQNATRAGVAAATHFTHDALTSLTPPDAPPGLVIVNPPYGERIGDKRELFGLYGALGKVLKERFKGWRVGIVTSDAGLAKATTLKFLPTGKPVLNGGIRVRLFRTATL
jgi:putative N6-adenine-specific DNA methylase